MVPHPTSREALSSGVTRPGSHSETGPHLTPARQPAAVQGRADPVWGFRSRLAVLPPPSHCTFTYLPGHQSVPLAALLPRVEART